MKGPELLLRLEQNPPAQRVMRVQMDNGWDELMPKINSFPQGHARDRFVYSLVGIMSCYVNRPTLEKAIKEASQGIELQPVPRGQAALGRAES